LERLYSALARGPAINCHPGNSRQRVDLERLALLEEGTTASSILTPVLGSEGRIRLSSQIEKLPPRPKSDETPEDADLRRRRTAQDERTRLLKKLAVIAGDADTFLRDTGSYVLYIGYPLLSLPDAGGTVARG